MMTAERIYFAVLAARNRDALALALDSITPGQGRIVIGISYDDDYRYGPRGVGIATVAVADEIVRVRYLVKEGANDRVGRYSLSLDDAVNIVQLTVGTREALNFARLGF